MTRRYVDHESILGGEVVDFEGPGGTRRVHVSSMRILDTPSWLLADELTDEFDAAERAVSAALTGYITAGKPSILRPRWLGRRVGRAA